MAKWMVYMLQCADNSFYTGITTDLHRRVQQHNNGTGAKYTRSRRPVLPIYREYVDSYGDALKREYAIKQLSHQQKEELILSEKNQVTD